MTSVFIGQVISYDGESLQVAGILQPYDLAGNMTEPIVEFETQSGDETQLWGYMPLGEVTKLLRQQTTEGK